MLDDLKYIHERDAQDALGVARKQGQQYQHDYAFQWQPPREIFKVVVAGMGGSGLAAKALKSWPGLAVPYEVVQDYTLPAYIDETTLVVCSSYSGNTEETLAALDEALGQPEAKRPMLAVIASGGKLLDAAKAQGLPSLQLPGGYQPRMTFGFQFRALLELFEQAGLCKGAVQELTDASQWLEQQLAPWLPEVPAVKNPAKQLAQELMGKSPVIYAGPKLFPAAYKWKISFNENAKNIAWCGQLPEFNHNEFIGWISHPTEKPSGVIDLRSNLEHERTQKRFGISDRLLSGKRPAAHAVDVQGDTLVRQLLWSIALGDFVSLYVALLNGLNPTPVDLIGKLKGELA